jgi:hypothetical protein
MMATYHLVRSISAGKRRERRIACLDDLVPCRCRVPSPTIVAGRAGRRSRCNASGSSAREKVRRVSMPECETTFAVGLVSVCTVSIICLGINYSDPRDDFR